MHKLNDIKGSVMKRTKKIAAAKEAKLKKERELQKAREEEEERSKVADLHKKLLLPLSATSRQRLLALKNALRKVANLDNKIPQKELYKILEQEEVRIPKDTYRLLLYFYDSAGGVQYLQFYKCLEQAHRKTGRDSVYCLHVQSKVVKHLDDEMKQDAAKRDQDLQERLEKQFYDHSEFFDCKNFRVALKKVAGSKECIPSPKILEVCQEQSLPIYGALLTATINRCKESVKKPPTNWNQFMTTLEKAYESMLEKNPDKPRKNPLEEHDGEEGEPEAEPKISFKGKLKANWRKVVARPTESES